AGFYGIILVLTTDIAWHWDMPSTVVKRSTSTIAALGHTIAKFYVIISRYVVLRSASLSDNLFDCSWIVAMLVAQLVIPIIAA
ncbi:hypothetical protein PENTCL1PPCAC_28950, partial [Pristionchus entomophagus]